MKYRCQDNFMIRVPSLPINIFRKIDKENTFAFEDIQCNDKIREFIEESTLVASKTLYDSLMDIPTSRKKKHNLDLSILKYLIRASTRPTPYGLFAGVGLGEFSDVDNIIMEEKQFIKDIIVDSSWISHVIHKIEKIEDILDNLKIKFNPICYAYGERIYNPYFSNHGEVIETNSETIDGSDIRYTELIKKLQHITGKFVLYIDVIEQIQVIYPNVPVDKIRTTLNELLENEYLFTNLKLPAYCSDPLLHVINILKEVQSASSYLYLLEKINTKLISVRKSSNGASELLEVYNQMKMLYECKDYCVVNKGIFFKSNFLNVTIRSKLEYFAETLSLLALRSNTSILEKFKNAYTETFGYNIEINIMDIINPEGFNGLSYFENFNTPELDIREKSIRKIIDEKILLALMNGNEYVKLYRSDFAEFFLEEFEYASVSFDANFYVYRDLKSTDSNEYIITVAPNGGATNAGGMFQRFADTFNKEDLITYNTLYEKEKLLKKENYIFSEIRESPSKGRHLNLLNRYKNYETYIPIGCDANNPQEIELKDLYVGLSNSGELYLYSRLYQKKIKAVTDNMLNSKMNSKLLKLLKYISDVYESEPVGRVFSLTTNKYAYTPRILLDEIIISPKLWKLSFSGIKNTNITKFKENFFGDMNQYNIEKYLLAYQGDNRVLINTEKEWGLELLYTMAKKDKSLTLSEIPGGFFSSQIVRNGNGDSFFSEYTFSFLQNEVLNKNLSFEKVKDKKINILLQQDNRKLLPGADGWIYLKLYGSRCHQNLILLEIPLLLANTNTLKFFFLRYKDTEEHLRLRFQFNSEEEAYSQMPKLIKWSRVLEKKGLLNKIVIDTYERENNRYGGAKLIQNIENIFYIDSLLTIQLIKNFDVKLESDIKLLYMVEILSTVIACTDSLEVAYEMLDRVHENKQFKENFLTKKTEYLKITQYIIQDKLDCIDPRFGNLLFLYEQRKKILSLYKKNLSLLEITTNDKKSIIGAIAHMSCNRLTGNKDFEKKYSFILCQSVKATVMKERYCKPVNEEFD